MKGDISKAKKYLESCLISFSEKLGDQCAFIAEVSSNLGLIYKVQKDTNRAIFYLQRALDIYSVNPSEDKLNIA